MAWVAARRDVEVLAHSVKGLKAHETSKGQGELGEEVRPRLHGDEPASQSNQAIDGHCHVCVARAPTTHRLWLS